MRSIFALGVAGLILLTWGLAGKPATATGDDPAKPGSAISLVDGRTLDGWKVVAGSKAGKVSVEGDSLALGVGSPMTGITLTRTDLPTLDYALTFEAKRTAGNDFFAAATFPVGDSFVTLVNGGWGGSVTGLSMINGASASENETNHFVKYQNDVWYAFEVQVTARAIRCRVDDAEVFVFDHEGAQLKTRIETRANEPLGFAAYRSSGLIRKVRVKSLMPHEITEIDSRIK